MIGIKEKDSDYSGIANGDKLKLLITGFEFPKFYLDAIKESDFVKQEQNRAMGLPFTPTMPSHKYGGMVMKCAIIEVNDKPVIKIEGDKVKLPNFFVNVWINQLTLPQIHAKNIALEESGKYFGYYDQMKGLSTKFAKNKTPKFIDIHPKSGIAQDFESKVYANAIPLGFEDAYADLIREETQRKQDWLSVLGIWNSLTEHEATTELLEGLSRRFALAYRTDKGFEMREPEVGMTFICQAQSAGTKYWKPIGHKWNAGDKCWDVFNPIPNEKLSVSKRYADLAVMVEQAIAEKAEAIKTNKAKKEAEEYDADKEALDAIVAEGGSDEEAWY